VKTTDVSNPTHLITPKAPGRRDRDRMVVTLATTCAIGVYDHKSCEFESHSWRGVLDATSCDTVCQ
jgi:hypothetical protein